MADNFLEKQYDDYLRRKAKAEAAKRMKWKKRLKEYQERQAKTSSLKNAGECDSARG